MRTATRSPRRPWWRLPRRGIYGIAPLRCLCVGCDTRFCFNIEADPSVHEYAVTMSGFAATCENLKGGFEAFGAFFNDTHTCAFLNSGGTPDNDCQRAFYKHADSFFSVTFEINHDTGGCGGASRCLVTASAKTENGISQNAFRYYTYDGLSTCSTTYAHCSSGNVTFGTLDSIVETAP